MANAPVNIVEENIDYTNEFGKNLIFAVWPMSHEVHLWTTTYSIDASLCTTIQKRKEL